MCPCVRRGNTSENRNRAFMGRNQFMGNVGNLRFQPAKELTARIEASLQNVDELR